jgi:hypothetical protein
MATRSGDIDIRESTTRSDETGLEVQTSSDLYASDDEASLASADANGDDRTEEIKAKIEETRADMGETIDAIQERLSFANISEQVSEQVSNAIETAKETVYDATIGKVVHFMRNTGDGISHSPVVRTVKENPLPFILIGAGAGLLAYQGFSGRGRRSIGGYQRRQLGSMRQTGDDMDMSATQSTVSATRDKVSNAAETAYRNVSRVAENTYAEAGQLANQAIEKAGNIGHKAQETYEQMLEERPWAIGIAALAAGAAVGMAIPSTRYEGELMGEARANLVNKVQEAADGFVDRAKQAASEAGRNLTEEAKSLAEDTIG